MTLPAGCTHDGRCSFNGDEPWVPSVFVRPLTEDFITDGDRLLKVVDLAWNAPEGPVILDCWQRALIRHLLERYPDDYHIERLRGRLRWRQAVVSLGRQNGKSVIGAILALYGLLLHERGPEVVSIASTVAQAEIVYKRVKHVIDTNVLLSNRYTSTGTRGIRSEQAAHPGTYYVKTGKEDSLQGLPISLCLGDELHLWKVGTWEAIVLGSTARKDGLIVGITTAGDANSSALAQLYKVGHAAARAEGEYDDRFFFALWEAASHLAITDPEFFIQGNPAIACGRLSLEQEMNAARSMPEMQVRRYRGNQFVASESSWMSNATWTSLTKAGVPEKVPFVLTVDRSPSWSAATITASARIGDTVHTEVVASLVNPTMDLLETTMQELYRRHKPMKIFMRASVLMDLSRRLRERGIETEFLTTTQMQNVCALAYAAISEGRVAHAHDWVVSSQMPKAVSKNVGDGWILSTKDSTGDIDAVHATVIGIYGAEVTKPKASAVYVGGRR